MNHGHVILSLSKDDPSRIPVILSLSKDDPA